MEDEHTNKPWDARILQDHVLDWLADARIKMRDLKAENDELTARIEKLERASNEKS